jgi:hypothetical protein
LSEAQILQTLVGAEASAPASWTLAFLAVLSHLALDDFSYWLELLGLTTVGKPEIFWLYPFDPRRAQAFIAYSSLRPSIVGFITSYTSVTQNTIEMS